ncbi:MAG: tetratricopeptide repeat protein [Verrucomicrobiaceae bacterium]|nr:tetratricopeptide repeat protein [Verrucomicrobiaceae bacterium]
MRFLHPWLLLLATACMLKAQDDQEPKDPFGLDDPPEIAAVDRTTAEIAATTRGSLVVVTQKGRDGQTTGTGSGFVISEDGLIATCAHVIGESRPIIIRFEDGEEHEVTAIHAWDRTLDLAILRINAEGLTPLPLAEPENIKQGADVIAMGNPQGLEFSVVRGVVSGLRDIENQSLIQIAIPIEPGNSGGPLLDTEGSVHGLLNMKSAITDNLGFAIPVSSLLRLLDKPNAVPMDKWLTIGQLNPARWKTLMGARWRQRAGRITVVRPGNGFGGRSLCINQRQLPAMPYEVAVEVKLDDESGAAGLIFESNGGDKHYGFYPSAGNMRLTRFEGPDVLSWTILGQVSTKSYRPGEWNRIRVRVDEKKITGFVNGDKVLELEDGVLRGGKTGLAKFRATEAEFKRFETGTDIAPDAAPQETIAKLRAHIEKLAGNPGDIDAVSGLAENADLSRLLLQRKIKALTTNLKELEEAANRVHCHSIRRMLINELNKGEESDLITCALLLAKHDNPDLDINAYHEEIERMAGELSRKVAPDAPIKAKVAAIADYLFEDNGYHGSRTDYYNRSNSYLNEVIDDREGIPITLSILFIELAGHLDADLKGLGLPGHFVVCYEEEGKRTVIDAFERGKPLTAGEANKIIDSFGGGGVLSDYPPSGKRAIIQRMVYNLKGISIEEKDYLAALRYVNLLIALDPNDAQEHLSRALLHVQNGQGDKAKPDLEWLFERKPEGIHLSRLRELYDRL